MFSWFGDKPQILASRTVDVVLGLRLPPGTSTLMAPLPIPGTTPVPDTLLCPSPALPVPAHELLVPSILAIATHVPSPVLVSLPAPPPLPPPLPPPPPSFLSSLFAGPRNKLEAVYAAACQSLLAKLQTVPWFASASAMINNMVGQYSEVLVMACVAFQQSPFAELAVPVSFLGGGTLTVNDLLMTILGDGSFDLLEPAILLAKQAFHTWVAYYKSYYYKLFMALNNRDILRPESLLPLLEAASTFFFAADALPLPRWLRIFLEMPLVFRWFRALLWAALSSFSVLAHSWLRKLIVLLPQWLREPVEVLLPPQHQFTLFLEAFDDYVSNELPTHLIRLQDMKLVGRDDIREALRPRIARMTEADLTYQTLCYNLLNPNNQVGYNFTLAIQCYLKFAIFSHRWGPQEPSFRAMMEANPEALRMFPQGPGFQKLLKFCREARRFGCAYAWSDTCCINKESSSELQEAIRSMYRWYQNAEICIAYLGESISEDDFMFEPWFTRGWTLQELLAPRRIKFYGKYWNPIRSQRMYWTNDKLDSKLMKAIEQVTMIPLEDLKQFTPSCSRVYEKMMWASKRRTTRVEDRAYCLLGIFDITMSIAYGEGTWAFHRLMEIILQRCGESGILAWSGETSPYSLAIPASPACYTALSFIENYRDLPSATLRALHYGMDEIQEVEKRLGLTDSVSFTLTKDGLDVEMFVVNATMTSAHQRNEGSKLPWDEPRPSLNLADLRYHDIVLHPKWTLRRNRPKKPVQARADERDLQRCSTWAIGILCSRDADGHATLEAGKEYMWFLIGKVRKGRRSVWVRFRTQNIPTLVIERNVRSRLQTIHIPHKL
ncbi:heterokaryon incompatibility protein-domain-containing protein [Boletus edulis]|nr:heterokaryon incompatibility protein-domain-containing protein [Boletus edulis]